LKSIFLKKYEDFAETAAFVGILMTVWRQTSGKTRSFDQNHIENRKRHEFKESRNYVLVG
jgi:hypothetical protein